MSDDIFSSTLNQAGQVGKVLIHQGPHAAVATAMAKAGAALNPATDSEIPEAVQWNLDKANGVHLKEVALKRGWPRLGPGTYHDYERGHIYYEEDPEDLAEQIVAEGL